MKGLPLRTPVAIFLLAGLAMVYYPTLFSGFGRMQADTGDTRLNNYILEHGYRWITFREGHEEFWSPSFYYPEKNVAAYSDILLSVLPFYAMWRVIGFLPDTSFQLYMFTVSSLNYLVFYFFLRRCFNLGRTASIFGAFLFAFGSPRTVQMSHQQLLPGFYGVFALFALFHIFGDKEKIPKKQKTLWIFLFFLSCAAQLFSGFYLGWFLGFALGVAFVWAVLLPSYRGPMLITIRENIAAIAVSAILCAAIIYPMAAHYYMASKSVGMRDFAEVSYMIPIWKSWIYLGDKNIMYGWIGSLDFLKNREAFWEHRLGVGFVTTLLVLAGMWRMHRLRYARLFVYVFFTLMALSTLFPGEVTAWSYVYDYVPGGSAIRAVSRISLIMLVPVAVAAAIFFDDILNKWPLLLLLPLIAFSMAEQGQRMRSYNKKIVRSEVSRIVNSLDTECESFFFTTGGDTEYFENHLNAMWAQMESSIPTINGFSGQYPPGWGMHAITINSDGERKNIESALNYWIKYKNMATEKLCRIDAPPVR